MLAIYLLAVFLSLNIASGESDNFVINKSNEIGPYEPTWPSLDSRPLPEWYDEAKVGIFIHWGVYSVPTMGTEWFWRHWKTLNLAYVNYMLKNYRPGFTYQEFAEDFTAEHFDAEEWAKIFADSGARYVVLTSKHHDGYTLWPSKHSFSWNSKDIGPHRDIIGDLSSAIRKITSLKFGLYHSLFEWYNPMYIDDKHHLFLTGDYVQNKVLPELHDLVNTYKPEILWSDGEGEAPYRYWKSREFLAWLYNESPVNVTVVTNDRWGMETPCRHGGFYTCGDRFNPGVLQDHKWENAMTIDKQSWGHRANAKLEDFLTSKELIKELVITISCGGNILVNVGPTKSGIIEPIYVERLREMGKWLRNNGAAIYHSVPWKYQNDTQTPNVWYTANRDPVNERQIVYAIILEYPYDTESIDLHSITGNYDKETGAILVGYPGNLSWTESSNGAMSITLPRKSLTDKIGLDHAWTIRLDIPMQ